MPRPLGVTILAILYVVTAAAWVVLGLYLIEVSTGASTTGAANPGDRATALILMGVGALNAVVGIGLWNLWNWARLIMFVPSAINVVAAALGMMVSGWFGGPIFAVVMGVGVAINLWAAHYLSQPNVKQAFGASPR